MHSDRLDQSAGANERLFVLNRNSALEFRPPRKRGEVRKGALHRQPVLLRQLLQRNQRPRADVLDHLGRGKRAQPSGILISGVAHQTEQKACGKEIAGARGVHEPIDRKRGHRDDAIV